METQIKPRPIIDLHSVESSQIAAIGHDAETNTLAVQFPVNKSGLQSLYHYANFTKDDYVAFMTAESKGSHFKKFIKDAKEKHPYERIQ